MIRRIVEKSSTIRIFMFLFKATSGLQTNGPAPGPYSNDFPDIGTSPAG